MIWLTPGWVRRSRRAARENVRSSTTARNTSKCANSISERNNINTDYTNRKYINLRYVEVACIVELMRPPSNGEAQAELPDRLFIFDTTLRDGEQSPGCSMREDEKLRMAHQLAKLGVDIIEAGFPISSHGDFRAVSRIAAEVEGPKIAALARAKEQDIDCAWRAIRGAKRRRIHTFLATSDIHLAC